VNYNHVILRRVLSDRTRELKTEDIVLGLALDALASRVWVTCLVSPAVGLNGGFEVFEVCFGAAHLGNVRGDEGAVTI
jgi:hypothetical protein